MSSEAGSSDLSDPMQGYSYLSLFPRTFGGLAGAGKQTELSDLELAHNVLKTMALKEPDRHIEQARRIVESISEDKQSENAANAAVQEEYEGVGLINEENARIRRPGLGRKQAKFILNRRISQPVAIKEPTLDIAKLEDPEEFFLAHEKLENAKKEVRKQSGIFTGIEVNVNELSRTARPRRPGIPGRLKATYKHHNYDGLKESSLENIEKGIMSPSFSLPPESVLTLGTSMKNLQSPSNDKIQQERTDPIKNVFQGGSVSEGNGFLDEILSGTYDHLNSDGQITLLQEKLQINPIHLDKLSKLPDIPNYDFNIYGNFPKPRKSLADIQAAVTGMNTKTPVRAMHPSSSVHLSASPTPPKSPFAYLSSLKKRIMQENRSKDPFLDFSTDPFPVGGSSPVNCEDNQPAPDVVQEESSSKLKVFDYDEDISAVSNKPSPQEVLHDSTDFPIFADDMSTVLARTSGTLPKLSGSTSLDKIEIPVEPESRPERSNSSPTKELSDTQMQDENGATHAPNPVQLDSSINDQHRSPGADSHAQQSTFANFGSKKHEVMQVKNVTETSINKKTSRKTVPIHKTNIVRKNQNSRGRLQRTSIAAAGTDAQEYEPSSAEVQAENMIANSSGKPDPNIDNQGPTPDAELHENPSEIPDTTPELMDVSNPKLPQNRQSKAKNIPRQEQKESDEEEIRPQKKQMRKEVSLRKSMAVAGTSFESGVRRSKRLKMRPLEYWRGERFLYGRLEPDSTLPTLIGVKKYDSAARQKGKAVLQVVDCVDGEKYRELIDLAALH
ncbi:hypothetical protein QQ045_017742 [Rhodiola kirilowii]